MSRKKRVLHLLNQLDAIAAAPEKWTAAEWALLMLTLCLTDRQRGIAFLQHWFQTDTPMPDALKPVLGGVLAHYWASTRAKAEKAALLADLWTPVLLHHRARKVEEEEDEATGLLRTTLPGGALAYSPLLQSLYMWSAAGLMAVDARAMSDEVAAYEVQLYETDQLLWSETAGSYENRDSATLAPQPTPILERYAPLLAEVPTQERAETMLRSLMRHRPTLACTAADAALLWLVAKGLKQYEMGAAANAMSGWIPPTPTPDDEDWRISCFRLCDLK